MTNQLFETALGIKAPWFVQAVNFDASQRRLTIDVDFPRGTRFPHPEVAGEHPVHDTQIKQLRHLNFFQHECYLQVRVPRVRLPDGKVALVEPDWVGKLSGFTLLFEALVLMLAQQMPFAAVARTVGETWHRVHAICARYVELALERTDLSAVDAVAFDETSYKRGHNYLTLAADTDARRVVFVTEGRDADTIAGFAAHLRTHKADPENIKLVCIDMSPAFIRGVTDNLPDARITFDKFHVIAHASHAVDQTRRLEQKTDPALKGLRWALLKDRSKLSHEQATDLDRLVAQFTTKRTARAWLYREQLRDILNRKQINVVSTMLKQWCTNVLRSKVEPMKGVATMIRSSPRFAADLSSRSTPPPACTTTFVLNWTVCSSPGPSPRGPRWIRMISVWRCRSRITRSTTAISKEQFPRVNMAGALCSCETAAIGNPKRARPRSKVWQMATSGSRWRGNVCAGIGCWYE